MLKLYTCHIQLFAMFCNHCIWLLCVLYCYLSNSNWTNCFYIETVGHFNRVFGRWQQWENRVQVSLFLMIFYFKIEFNEIFNISTPCTCRISTLTSRSSLSAIIFQFTHGLAGTPPSCNQALRPFHSYSWFDLVKLYINFHSIISINNYWI
jgi:hypothetical protein